MKCIKKNPFHCSFLPSGGRQETVCLLQNATKASNPSATPIRAFNQYYMVKMSIRSGEKRTHLFIIVLKRERERERGNKGRERDNKGREREEERN